MRLFIDLPTFWIFLKSMTFQDPCSLLVHQTSIQSKTFEVTLPKNLMLWLISMAKRKHKKNFGKVCKSVPTKFLELSFQICIKVFRNASNSWLKKTGFYTKYWLKFVNICKRFKWKHVIFSYFYLAPFLRTRQILLPTIYCLVRKWQACFGRDNLPFLLMAIFLLKSFAPAKFSPRTV